MANDLIPKPPVVEPEIISPEEMFTIHLKKMNERRSRLMEFWSVSREKEIEKLRRYLRENL